MEIKKIEDPKLNNPDTFDTKKAIIIIIVFMIIIGVLWFSVSKIKSSGPKDISKINFNFASTTAKATKPAILEDSFYKGYVKITAVTPKETYPEKEYITISLTQQNLSEVDVTNWKLQNSKGEEVALGQGMTLPYTGKVNEVSPIKIKGGDLLTVSTGRSPIGVSFRMNSCTPYLEQFQDFIPPITGRCPQASGIKSYASLDSACRTYVRQIPACTTNTKTLPSDLSAECMTFIYSNVNYNGCVSANKNAIGFYANSWRIFLGRKDELWAQAKETINLLDSEGKLISSLKY